MLFDGGFFHGGPYGLIWGLMAFFMNLLVLAAIVWLVVVLVRKASSEPGRTHPRSRAIAVLEERYARGEISRQEFFERRAVLAGEDPGGGT